MGALASPRLGADGERYLADCRVLADWLRLALRLCAVRFEHAGQESAGARAADREGRLRAAGGARRVARAQLLPGDKRDRLALALGQQREGARQLIVADDQVGASGACAASRSPAMRFSSFPRRA
jgi:hypothetical protein